MDRSSDGFVVFIVSFAVFTDGLIFDMVVPFLPDLFSEKLGVPDDRLEFWLAMSLEVFGIASLIASGVAGKITDATISKSRPFVLGVLVMLVSTWMFFLSPTVELVMVARTIQGASQAFLWVSGVAFLVARVSKDSLGSSMGFLLMGETIGELIGPLLGGPLYSRFGHWAVFAVVELLMAVDIGLRLLVKDRKGDDEKGSDGPPDENFEEAIPLQQTAPAGVGRASTDSDVESGSRDSKSDVDEDDDDDKLAEDDLSLLESTEPDCSDSVAALQSIGWNGLGSMTAIMVAAVIRCGLIATLSLVVLRRFSWSPSAAGGLMFALLLPTILGPSVGRYAGRTGPRWWSIVSFGVCGGLLVSLGFLTDGGTVTKVLFVLHVALIGVCVTVMVNAHSSAVLIAAQKIDGLRDQARTDGQKLNGPLRLLTSGLMVSGLSVAWSLGIFLGPACANAVEFTESSGWAYLCWSWGASCLITGTGTWFSWRRHLS